MLKALRESYESRGYTFFVAPARELLPAFLKSHPPDAIAIGDNENIAFEVTAAHGPHVVEQLKRLRELFRDQPKWRLEVVFKTPRKKKTVISTSQPLPASRNNCKKPNSSLPLATNEQR
jgi:hypothetical protein